jgi:hypothetical protein
MAGGILHRGGPNRREELAIMVTNYPHPMTHQGLRQTVGTERSSGFARVLTWLQQTVCGLSGHDALLHFEEERMSLRCASCGHESPGWELNETPPTVTVRGDARRHALVRPQLVSPRRIA